MIWRPIWLLAERTALFIIVVAMDSRTPPRGPTFGWNASPMVPKIEGGEPPSPGVAAVVGAGEVPALAAFSVARAWSFS